MSEEKYETNRALEIDATEIERRKAFLEFGEEDVARLQEIAGLVKEVALPFVEDFYAHLRRFEEVAPLIADPATLERLKASQLRYFQELFAGDYGARYVEKRLAVGMRHHRVGLEPAWYLGGFCRYLSTLAPLLWERYRGDPARAADAFRALCRIVFFDIGFAVESYFAAHRALLERSERRYRELVESLDGIVWEFDPKEGRDTFVSPQAERILGYPMERWYSKERLWLRTIAPEDREAVERNCSAVYEGKPPAPFEYRAIHASGRRRWMRSVCWPVPGVAGEIGRLRGFTIDITDRKEAEAEVLRRAEQQAAVARLGEAALAGVPLERLFETAVSRLAEHLETDFAKFLEYLPDRAGLLLRAGVGWDEGLVGSYIVPADTGSQAGYTLLSKTPVVVEDVEAETRFEIPALLRKHGVRSGMSTVVAGKETPFGVLAVHTKRPRTFSPHDLSFLQSMANILGSAIERQHAEREIRCKNEQITTVHAAMTLFLDTGDLRKANRLLLRRAIEQTRSVYGFLGVLHEGEVLRILYHDGVVWDASRNHSFYEAAMKRYREEGYLEFRNFDNLFGAVLRTGKPVISNDPANDPRAGGLPEGHPPLSAFLGVPILRGDGVVGIIGLANRPGGYGEAEARVIGFLAQTAGVLYDSFLRREREAALEEQLRLSQKLEAVGTLAGGIAHDFNNMLSVIIGQAELGMMRLSPSDPLHARLEEIFKAGMRSAGLTKQLLTFARKQSLSPVIIDINKRMPGLLEMLRPLIGEDVEITWKPGPSLCPVKIDPTRFDQIVTNLAVNARDAMPEGGRIAIETRHVSLGKKSDLPYLRMVPGDYVFLSFSDTGTGMDPVTVERIFEPFFTTKEQGKGTGLGLATVYGIVKQSGGYIWVESKPGAGTTFKLYFPCAEGEAREREAPQAAAGSVPERATILVAEDEDALRLLLQESLGEAGYTLLVAADGKEALDIAQRHAGPIDLLLTDVVMPGMKGTELVRRLKEIHPAMEILYMSGYADRRGAAFEGEGKRWLEKPFTTATLLERIRQVLATRSANEPSPG